MITLLGNLLVAKLANQDPPAIKEFVADYKARKSDWSPEAPDPAIERAIGVLTRVVVSNLKRNPHASQRTIDGWLAPFHDAIDIRHKDSPTPDEYRSLEVEAPLIYGYRFVSARMGSLSHSIAFAAYGHSIALPKEFQWNLHWYPLPQQLPNGVIMLREDSIQSEGNTVPERFVWLKVKHSKAVELGAFEGTTTLDNECATVKGNEVNVKTEDEPLALKRIFATDFRLERDTTWISSPGGFRLLRSEPKQLALRAVDTFVYKAWHAQKPTHLQSRVGRLLAKAHLEIEDCSESRLPNAMVDIRINHEAVFHLKRTKIGYRVVGVAASSS